VRNELEHLLNDDRDMAELYLTRKYLQSQVLEASTTTRRQSALSITASLSHIKCHQLSIASIVTSVSGNENDVEDIEMLLEAYFMQIDGTRNKILSAQVVCGQLGRRTPQGGGHTPQARPAGCYHKGTSSSRGSAHHHRGQLGRNSN